MAANLTQILNFKANFHQEFELFSKKTMLLIFDLTLFSKIKTCITDNDVTYIIMQRTAQESSKYLFPLWSFHKKIAD